MLSLLSRLIPAVAIATLVLTRVASSPGSPQSKDGPKLDPDHAAKMAKGTELFKSQVRGILQSKCLKCHSGDRVEGEFDMGTRESLLKGGTRGTAVVPHDHRKSLLWQLTAHQKKPHMPDGRPKLADEDIQKIAEWIDLGAPYDRPFLGKDDAWTRKVIPREGKKHWAYQPIHDVRPSSEEGRNPIDAFLRSKLEKAGVKPNPPADPRTLIRRVYLDLIGLPPTPEQVDAFLKDASPSAYEKLVDELLASPRYGEKSARHWLDLVRFAESHGFEHDYDRPTAYHYRDFVIKALNQDLPFDTFTKWQIAGDEFAPDNPLAMMATGYLAAGVHSTQITANEVEKQRYDELDDILGNIGTTFLGLTIGCARCHDHKYDPIPSCDYYRMLSAFTTTVRSEVDLDLDPRGYQNSKAAFDVEHKKYTEALSKYEKEELPAKFAEWEKARGGKRGPVHWILPPGVSLRSSGGAKLTALPDGSFFIAGKNPTTETLTFGFTTDLEGVRSLRLEALTDSRLVKGGPGRATNGNFALSSIAITVEPKEKTAGGGPVPVKLVNARATFEQKGLPVAAAIDDDPKSAWAIDPQFGKGHAAVFAFDRAVGFPGGTIYRVSLSFNNNTGHGIGRPRLSLSFDEMPGLAGEPVPDATRVALATPPGMRTPEQLALVIKWFAPRDPEFAKLRKAEEDHAAKAPNRNLVKALVSSEGLPPIRLHTQGGDFLKQTHYLRRGDPGQKEGVAQESFLQVLMPAAGSEKQWVKPPPPGSRTSWQRTALANWLTDTQGGAGCLTARVIVNRLWQQHFGRGIVATVSDFGSRGEPPTHPELLDYLASELIRGGWTMKPIHKQIVMSAAYRQSSEGTSANAKIDPEN
ncbi:MAG TPA: PSD1 and planctomycete cytochrome C domain-containing protein, partial [Gemmata sp.]|nr:PSD1 and planctomycete cytochrome C domain-containing protein [Gemmata sp.]